MVINNQDSQGQGIIDLFPQTRKKDDRQSTGKNHRLLKHKLGEVILGHRPFLKVYSEALQADFWFVNEGLADPTDRMFNGKVITMELLVEIMAARQPVLKAVEELSSENQ